MGYIGRNSVICWNIKQVVVVFEMFAANQLCSDCGHQNKYVKNLKLCEWKCFSCDIHHDWDTNAGMKFRNEAIRPLTVGTTGIA